MKVLFVISKHFKDSQTGAGTQVRETIRSVQKLGCDVGRIYVKFYPVCFEDEDGNVLSYNQVVQLTRKYDVAHLIHCSSQMAAVWRTIPKMPTVGSSIYWGGWERVIMALKTNPFSVEGLRTACRFVRSMIPLYFDLRGVDVLLPNSHAEGECVRRYARLTSNATIFPVNNGFIPPTYKLEDLRRSPLVPNDDYIVVPGIIVSRKNQLGLIKAIRDLPYQVVFMGGYDEKSWFYCQCQKWANERMRFLGYIQHDSEEYWSVLRDARCAVLASDCETPGIAMIEAAYAGARPIITKFGGTIEYYGFDAEYFDPRYKGEIKNAVVHGWSRGRLSAGESQVYSRFSWDYCATLTVHAYEIAVNGSSVRSADI